MADTDQSLSNLRYNQVTNVMEVFCGGSPMWTPLSLSSGGGMPGGPSTAIQFNSAGSFGGDASFTIDIPDQILSLGTLNDIFTVNSPSADVSSSDTGGSITIAAGNGASAGGGGSIELLCGSGDGVGSGHGGNVLIEAGAGTTPGFIILIGGTGSSSAPGGNITLRPGQSGGDGAGTVVIEDPTSTNTVTLDASGLTVNRTLAFPDASGTIALQETSPTIITRLAITNQTTQTAGAAVDTTANKPIIILNVIDGTTMLMGYVGSVTSGDTITTGCSYRNNNECSTGRICGTWYYHYR